ncbi:serine/threonine protein phosphatase PrpC [Mesorhizobium soli]|nr:serine/threonine protein phosphatase PrpC [Mesorhizobium soli]
MMAIVLDGATSGTDSGRFAREIARMMVDWFVTAAVEVNANTLVAQLRTTHATLAKAYRMDSASYVLLHLDVTQPALVLHAGDCLVGQRDAIGQTAWLLQPHTLANALQMSVENLAKQEIRHKITRSFRSKRFMAPDLNSFALDDRPLLAATDGFWAELSTDQQSAFLEGRLPSIAGERDDCGVLSILRNAGEPTAGVGGLHSPDTIYFRHG